VYIDMTETWAYDFTKENFTKDIQINRK
jgi:hypothetical protein